MEHPCLPSAVLRAMGTAVDKAETGLEAGENRRFSHGLWVPRVGAGWSKPWERQSWGDSGLETGLHPAGSGARKRESRRDMVKAGAFSSG